MNGILGCVLLLARSAKFISQPVNICELTVLDTPALIDAILK